MFQRILNYIYSLNNKKHARAYLFGGVVLLIITTLFFSGIIPNPFLEKFGTEVLDQELKLLSGQDAYTKALARAKNWQPDATLAHSNSLQGSTGKTGRSDDWDLIFVSASLRGRGFHIIIKNQDIITAEEIAFVGKGSPLPVNIISSQDAIAYVRTLKGFATTTIISVELTNSTDGNEWFWGVKTARGTVSIKALKQ